MKPVRVVQERSVLVGNGPNLERVMPRSRGIGVNRSWIFGDKHAEMMEALLETLNTGLSYFFDKNFVDECCHMKPVKSRYRTEPIARLEQWGREIAARNKARIVVIQPRNNPRVYAVQLIPLEDTDDL